MNHYLEVWRKYAEFSGRARREEYWYFVLFNFIIAVVLEVIAAFFHPLIVLYWLYALAIIIPSIAVGVRRLHDTDRSGWWYLIVFIPLVGAIVLIVFFATDSQPGANRFGPNPKGV